MHKSDLFRQASLLANKVVSTTVRVDDLGNDLKIEYQILFTFEGQSGASRQKLQIEEVEKKQKIIRPMQEKARGYLESNNNLAIIQPAEVIDVITEFEGNLAQVERVKEKFVFDIENVRADNRIYREKADVVACANQRELYAISQPRVQDCGLRRRSRNLIYVDIRILQQFGMVRRLRKRAGVQEIAGGVD